MASVNPTTGVSLESLAPHTERQLEDALAMASAAFERHRALSFAERAVRMRRVADLLERDVDAHANRMTREMGKPVSQARAEAEKCAWVCRYYAEHAETFLTDAPRQVDDAQASFVAYEPLGPVLAIMPWNFPYWQVFRFAAPTLMAGGVGLLKHAQNVWGCGDAIAEVFADAGFDDGVFQHLRIDHKATSNVIADDRVRAVTLTGSEKAGRSVGSQAGEALKPCLLELGGSDAFVVLADADLDRAVETGVQSRTQNNGQSCIAAKRFILEAPIASAFTERFVARMNELTVGDPMTDVDLGPLAREDLRETVHEQVSDTVSEGAEVLCGGDVPDGDGFFYPPTVLSNVRNGMLPFREEIFGPVASLTVAESADHAIELANATRFGLGGSIWTEDRQLGERLAREMRSGAAFVNEMTKSHPHLPFGGVGDSGFGRELGGEGIHAFVNAKTVWID
ncbi:MAG: NAD-dependent succinate-semialdehyde dehydrogenase [Rubricoccaceae bacterium]